MEFSPTIVFMGGAGLAWWLANSSLLKRMPRSAPNYGGLKYASWDTLYGPPVNNFVVDSNPEIPNLIRHPEDPLFSRDDYVANYHDLKIMEKTQPQSSYLHPLYANNNEPDPVITTKIAQ